VRKSGPRVEARMQKERTPYAWVSVVLSHFLRSPPPRPGTQPYGVFLLSRDYTPVGTASNGAGSEERYRWLRSERAHRWMAKLASMTEWLAGVAAP